MSHKSRTCFGKRSGQPLTEYYSESAAEDAALYVEQRFGRKMIHYRCQRCEGWHLTPADRHTPSCDCDQCVGSDGTPKKTYRNEEEASLRSRILLEERGLWLRTYPCPWGSGWHLTKA